MSCLSGVFKNMSSALFHNFGPKQSKIICKVNNLFFCLVRAEPPGLTADFENLLTKPF